MLRMKKSQFFYFFVEYSDNFYTRNQEDIEWHSNYNEIENVEEHKTQILLPNFIQKKTEQNANI